jgi:hypothetical protein
MMGGRWPEAIACMAPAGFVLIVIGLVGGLYVPYRLGNLYGAPLRSATPHDSSHR